MRFSALCSRSLRGSSPDELSETTLACGALGEARAGFGSSSIRTYLPHLYRYLYMLLTSVGW
jgi:hypothetical protein